MAGEVRFALRASVAELSSATEVDSTAATLVDRSGDEIRPHPVGHLDAAPAAPILDNLFHHGMDSRMLRTRGAHELSRHERGRLGVWGSLRRAIAVR